MWQHVLNATAKHLMKHGQLRIYSGAVYDQNGDGVRDSDDLIRCTIPPLLWSFLLLTNFNIAQQVSVHSNISSASHWKWILCSRKSDPSHLFFVLMWCKNRPLIGRTSCKDVTFVPYILPLKDRNLNCLVRQFVQFILHRRILQFFLEFTLLSRFSNITVGIFLCLQEASEYLHDNIARIRDIELLTGIEFFTDRSIWTDAEAVQLRTLLPEERLLP